ncbi:hypothetical protein HO133_007159 [Letharia lupina]|uniref:Uncharacterized protein n=1 Tax=Letharia lupina TaxID=560253 RepID=A0A8H6FI99_9LECA|nr:uncharacterized protein HO133_007159 [Letharia lupina]KAF6229045.1 hypothetical protein HO133_007159 [Letharia lupina]
MESKPANTFTGAAKLLPQQLVLPDAAEALKRAKIERFLRGTATFEQEQEAKAHASAAAPYFNLPARGQSMCAYELPVGLGHISGSLKIDDPPTPMRIGNLSTFIQKTDPLTGIKYWVGLTWAEIFFPVLGERPSSVAGSKAYEVVLKQPIEDGGHIVRENVVTTGRVVGVVVAELPHETVSVRIQDWFSKSDMFKKGRWNQLDIQARDGAGADLAVTHGALRGGNNEENSVRASCDETQR